jgi:hypothetical protein
VLCGTRHVTDVPWSFVSPSTSPRDDEAAIGAVDSAREADSEAERILASSMSFGEVAILPTSGESER